MKSLVFPHTLSFAQLLHKLNDYYRVRRIQPWQGKRVLLDTFDGRLFRHGHILIKTGFDYTLVPYKKAGLGQGLVCRTRKLVLRVRDLPWCTLKKKIAPWVEPRALLPQAEWRERRSGIVLFNRKQQVVGQGVAIESVRNKERFLLIMINGEKGFSADLRALIKEMKAWGGEQVQRNPWLLFLERLRIALTEYRPKRIVRLQPQWPAYQALTLLLAFQIKILLQNERGLRHDWDAEFLHDFRVAIRRARSILSLFKKNLPAKKLNSLRRDFRLLSEATNPLRDLDVQLLRRTLYHKLLPASLHPGLEKLLKAIARERQKEYLRFVRVLNGAAYQRIKKQWLLSLEQDKSEWASRPAGRLPTKQAVARLIGKKFGQLQKMKKEDWQNADDEALHRMRIEAKKLRYLLEFFSSLFPQPAMAPLLEQLRRVQDHLGHLNDLAVQQTKLLDHLQKKSPLLRHPQTIAAIGALVAVLHQEQEQWKNMLAATMEPFFAAPHKKAYRKLFQDALAR
ncbi:MAG TPA: CHAD domain-containing protein [bacterium]|nr:CHAD domain-containing protein [bacterium]